MSSVKCSASGCKSTDQGGKVFYQCSAGGGGVQTARVRESSVCVQERLSAPLAGQTPFPGTDSCIFFETRQEEFELMVRRHHVEVWGEPTGD